MTTKIILASGSSIRRKLFENAGVSVTSMPPKVDEQTIKDSLIHEQAKPRDIADTLAEYKARKVSLKNPDSVVIACDQVLDLDGVLFSKPSTQEDAKKILKKLRGEIHKLHSAAVIYESGKPVWRHVGVARMSICKISDDYISDYVVRNWDEIRHCVGCYQLEAEGVRLFNKVDGDYFTVLGIPLIEVLSYLSTKGLLQS